MKKDVTKVTRFTGRKLIAPCFMATLCAGLGLTLLHPFGNVRENSSSSGAILRGGNAGPDVAATFERACQNCHSTKTKWPWYSYVPPVSWMIEKDVATARRHMDLLQWQSYSAEKKVEKLSEISSLVRNHIMPPPRYALLHPEARLGKEDIQRISKWAHRERARLNLESNVSEAKKSGGSVEKSQE